MNLTCIVCPLGCSLDIKEEKGEIIEISGHGCLRGKKFAEAEFHNHERMITTIFSLDGGEYSFLPVISEGEVPKKELRKCIDLLKKTKVKAPIKMGDVIQENILNTGINIVAAKTARMGKR